MREWYKLLLLVGKMKYVALLRGINVGKSQRIEMKMLKALFESLGYTNVSTYINSGNILFESEKKAESIRNEIEPAMKKEFGFDIPVLLKTKREMQKIIDCIPKEWQNDSTQRTDVAYLFDEIDVRRTLDELPVKKEYINIRYTKGAIYWNVKRENVYKSNLNRLIGHKLYKLMTMRNVNTARYLAGHK
jgi:uncharacterized protein (DUF1697 family)